MLLVDAGQQTLAAEVVQRLEGEVGVDSAGPVADQQREVVDRWLDVFARLAKDADWQTGNARIGGIAAIRSPADTEKFVREQYELYDKLVGALGIRQ